MFNPSFQCYKTWCSAGKPQTFQHPSKPLLPQLLTQILNRNFALITMFYSHPQVQKKKLNIKRTTIKWKCAHKIWKMTWEKKNYKKPEIELMKLKSFEKRGNEILKVVVGVSAVFRATFFFCPTLTIRNQRPKEAASLPRKKSKWNELTQSSTRRTH